MYGIKELRQIAENKWKAKFQGDYGVYIIRITLNGKNTTEFSCSCPSHYSPCKHIPMVEEAITKRIMENEKEEKNNAQLDDFLKNIPAEKLRKFIIAQAEYNLELKNAVFLEFSSNIYNANSNKYSMMLRKSLESVIIDENEHAYKDWMTIDVLDQWFIKANKYLEQEQYDETILICKACIEEYSRFLYNADDDISLAFSNHYISDPFDIIIDALEHADKKDLFDYCLSEMTKKKYKNTDFYYGFQDVVKEIAESINAKAFIAIQDKLLSDIKDKSSVEAENILRYKIRYYRCLDQEKDAWAVIENNIQIESFHLKVIKRMIDLKKYEEAKKLINDFLKINKKNKDNNSKNIWNELLLDIAQKENDFSAIQKLSYDFIKDEFNIKYYKIYKASFEPTKWLEKRKKLFQHYCSEQYFNDSAGNLLKAENDKEFTMKNIERLLSLDELETFYKNIAGSDYTENILKMFNKVLYSYAENNTGKSFYEHILLLLKRMSELKGGKKAAMSLIKKFRITYDKRSLMLEILDRFEG